MPTLLTRAATSDCRALSPSLQASQVVEPSGEAATRGDEASGTDDATTPRNAVGASVMSAGSPPHDASSAATSQADAARHERSSVRRRTGKLLIVAL
jgi:hypothetical protein